MIIRNHLSKVMHFDIIIIGAGLSGLLMACALRNISNIKIAIIDKAPNKYPLDNKSNSRTIAISKNSKDILSSLGLWEEDIESNACNIEDIVITHGYSEYFVHYDSELLGYKEMGYNVPDYILRNSLYNEICKFPNITFFFQKNCLSVSQKDNMNYITLSNDEQLSTTLLIGADGKLSKIRSLLGINYSEKKYHQSAIVFNINHSIQHNNIAYEFFFRTGPFALLPNLPGNNSTVIWSDNIEYTHYLKNCDHEVFLNILKEKLNNKFGDIELSSSRFTFPLSLIISKEYYKKGAVLIGDALHSIHPVAGQGFNLSIKDIKCLSQLIQKYFATGISINSETMLSQFKSKRIIDNKQMSLVTDLCVNIFKYDSNVLNCIIEHGMKILQKNNLIKKSLIAKAMGITQY